MSETFDFKGKLEACDKELAQLVIRMERNKEWISDRGTYYYPSEAVKEYSAAFRRRHRIVKAWLKKTQKEISNGN